MYKLNISGGIMKKIVGLIVFLIVFISLGEKIGYLNATIVNVFFCISFLFFKD